MARDRQLTRGGYYKHTRPKKGRGEAQEIVQLREHIFLS